MSSARPLIFMLAALVGPHIALAQPIAPTDDEIRRILIERSRAEYDGPCPCPYDSMSDGRACGLFSAYEQAGGEYPLCFIDDVTPELIDEYRRELAEQSQF